MMRWLLSVAVVGLVGCSTDVRGFVRDGDTGEPLPGVMIRSGDQTAETDATGYYELEDVEEDEEDEDDDESTVASILLGHIVRFDRLAERDYLRIVKILFRLPATLLVPGARRQHPRDFLAASQQERQPRHGQQANEAKPSDMVRRHQ